MTAPPLPLPDEQLQRRSAGERAALYIRRLIFDGHLPPGSRVPQDEVAASMGISRIPVREALIALEREGWVTIEMHRGAFVNVLDEPAVRDHYELYGLTYGFAAERAVERAGPELGDRLGAVARSVARADGPDAVWRLTMDFHALVVEAAASPRIRVVLRAMSAMIPGNFFELVPGAIGAEKRGIAAVTRAVRAGHGDDARQAYVGMMRDQADRVVKLLAARGLLQPPVSEG
jgi:DNA-binding GntR family transcriptional regulator